MTNFAETITVDNIDIPIDDVNKIEKVVKPKKERSEKQKENDIKLKQMELATSFLGSTALFSTFWATMGS